MMLIFFRSYQRHFNILRFQSYIESSNPGFMADIINITPDADAEIDTDLIRKFNIPLCPDCGSDVMKPQVSCSDVMKPQVSCSDVMKPQVSRLK